eukprot:4436485-Pyramimonas_sp.AAC.1
MVWVFSLRCPVHILHCPSCVRGPWEEPGCALTHPPAPERSISSWRAAFRGTWGCRGCWRHRYLRLVPASPHATM